MVEREAGIERIYPTIFGKMGSRYYYLIQLRLKIEEIFSTIVASKKKPIVLADYGCGNRPYQSIVAPYVETYIGVDLPENKTADVHISADGKIQMSEKSIDLVLSTQVLEHVTNPSAYLLEAHRILKDDGLMILSTHGYWMFHPDPTDFWRWTSTGLKKIVEEAGFEVTYFKGIIGRSAMGIQLFQDGIQFKLPSFLRPVLALLLQPLIILFDKMTSQETRNKDACTFILVAKKK